MQGSQGARRGRTGTRTATTVGVVALTLLLTGLQAPGAQAGVEARRNGAGSPAVTGPVTGGDKGRPQTSVEGIVDLPGAGYVEQEFFMSGEAHSYEPDAGSTFGSDGVWPVHAAAATAPYTTRILVRRPADPKRFNGTVAVEWFNVTGQADGAPDFTEMQDELLDQGYAWVGVSAQELGVDNPSLGLRAWDPTRYGALTHPGDSYSYDIFSQAGQALRTPSGADPLGNLRGQAERYLALGESQSAARLVTYLDAVHPLVDVYDGFFVHSRFANGSPLSQAPLPAVAVPAVARIRTDLREPVFLVETETETDVPAYAPARQPDTGRIRTWEVAGTAHFDAYGLSFIVKSSQQDFGLVPVPPCASPFNDAGARYVYNAALRSLDRWVAGIAAPARGERLVLGPDGLPARDALGIATGGVRLPEMDVPVSVYSGLGNMNAAGVPADLPNFCALFGTTTPLSQDVLSELYPTHRDYAAKVRQAAAQARKAGFLLHRDAGIIRRAATASTVGNPA